MDAGVGMLWALTVASRTKCPRGRLNTTCAPGNLVLSNVLFMSKPAQSRVVVQLPRVPALLVFPHLQGLLALGHAVLLLEGGT